MLFPNGLTQNIIHVPKSRAIFRFGVTNKPSLTFRDSLIVREGEAWAIVGSSKTLLIEALVGKHRIAPPPPAGIFPFLSTFSPPKDPAEHARMVSFAYRRQLGGNGGGFYDYSARYGAVREEDRVTLRDSILGDVGGEEGSLLEELARNLGLGDKLDLPLIALSNGQTRRATVLRQLMFRPEVLFLDEPLTGLDVKQRPILVRLLYEHHLRRDPFIVLGLRQHDPLPDWITHLAVAHGEEVEVKSKEVYVSSAGGIGASASTPAPVPSTTKPKSPREDRPILVDVKGLNIKYADRHVLKDINWTIRSGDRWHLSGSNGSGKTTLLSILSGDHPQSHSLPPSSLTLFGSPRRGLATSQIQAQMGVASPEVFHAFPRRGGMTVRDTVGTGFESTFSYRRMSEGQEGEIEGLLRYFDDVLSGPLPGVAHSHSAASAHTSKSKFDDSQSFASLPTSHQSLILLLRALVGSPKLLILDEVFSGMDDRMVERAKQYLREELSETEQAVVFVSHWREEVPWPWKGSELLRMHLGDPD